MPKLQTSTNNYIYGMPMKKGDIFVFLNLLTKNNKKMKVGKWLKVQRHRPEQGQINPKPKK